MIGTELDFKLLSVETIPGVVSGEDKSSKDEKPKSGEEEEQDGIAPSYFDRSRLQQLKSIFNKSIERRLTSKSITASYVC